MLSQYQQQRHIIEQQSQNVRNLLIQNQTEQNNACGGMDSAFSQEEIDFIV